MNSPNILLKSLSSLFFALALAACSQPIPGPDKSVAGAVLGAGWGAGAGAIVGNQVGNTGQGAAVGAGFGLVNGAMTGAGLDSVENQNLNQERELRSLHFQNQANGQQLARLQSKLDGELSNTAFSGVYQVFFDEDQSNLRSGAIANLEVIADSLRQNPLAYTINVVGHSDDAGTPEYNQKLAEARASAAASYLTARGVSAGNVKVESKGSTQPIASNQTEAGRQLNRRVDVYITR